MRFEVTATTTHSSFQEGNDRTTSLQSDSTMTSVPYPSFVNHLPVNPDKRCAALVAAGKCRIEPETCTTNAQAYGAIVSKCVQQADARDDKALRKKFMKEAVAMAQSYLMETLELDVSVIDVEMTVDPEDLLKSNGCLASCLLDAGCLAIVTDGTNLDAMDVAKIPRERMVAHFSSPPSVEALDAAALLASIVSIDFWAEEEASEEQLTAVMEMEEPKNHQIVVQVQAAAHRAMKDRDLAAMIGKVSKHGVVALVDPSAKQLGLSYAACMKTDRPDGLFTTVVCTRAGEALGLVYSSPVSTRNAMLEWSG